MEVPQRMRQSILKGWQNESNVNYGMKNCKTEQRAAVNYLTIPMSIEI